MASKGLMFGPHHYTIEFSLNFFTEFSKWSDETICGKKVKGFEPAISCVRDLDAITSPARHM